MWQGVRRTLNSGDNLKVLLQEEKDVIGCYERLQKETAEAGKYMGMWAKGDGEDVQTVLECLSVVYDRIVEAQGVCAANHTAYRSKLKEIFKLEEAIRKARNDVQAAKDKVDEAQKKQKPLDVLNQQFRQAEQDLAVKEAQYHSSKRALLQQALHAQFDGLLEMSAKLSILAVHAKFIADQIPQGSLAPGQPLPAWEGGPVVKKILGDCLSSLSNWKNPNPGIHTESALRDRKLSVSSVDTNESAPVPPRRTSQTSLNNRMSVQGSNGSLKNNERPLDTVPQSPVQGSASVPYNPMTTASFAPNQLPHASVSSQPQSHLGHVMYTQVGPSHAIQSPQLAQHSPNGYAGHNGHQQAPYDTSVYPYEAHVQNHYPTLTPQAFAYAPQESSPVNPTPGFYGSTAPVSSDPAMARKPSYAAFDPVKKAQLDALRRVD